jgi:hypothetical protein
VASAKAVDAVLQETAQAERFNAAGEHARTTGKRAAELEEQVRDLARRGQEVPVELQEEQAAAVSDHTRAMDALRKSRGDYHEKGRKVTLENRVYFPLKATELAEPDVDVERLEMKAAELTRHQALTVDGDVIPDYRGVVYYEKHDGRISRVRVDAIGQEVPRGAIMLHEATREEVLEMEAAVEAERIAGLDPDARTVEMNAALDALAAECAQMRSIAEVRGESPEDALAYAQAEYNKRSGGIKGRYK